MSQHDEVAKFTRASCRQYDKCENVRRCTNTSTISTERFFCSDARSDSDLIRRCVGGAHERVDAGSGRWSFHFSPQKRHEEVVEDSSLMVPSEMWRILHVQPTVHWCHHTQERSNIPEMRQISCQSCVVAWQ